jgi:prevent-host-death family protein
MRSINASELKAKCLAILDEVEETGEAVTILKRGRPVALLLPPGGSEGESPQKALLGSVQILGDVLKPVLPEEAWEVLAGRRKP